MRNAEQVTFGGSALDRAAHLRAGWQALWNAGDGVAILLWRGKPLLEGGRAVRLPLDHPVLDLASDPPMFLGRDQGQLTFAVDISGWEPREQDLEQVGRFVDQSVQQHPDLPESQAFHELRQAMNRLSPREAELIASAKALMEWHNSHRFCSRCGQPSEMAMGGWERHCPACEAKHFPRTDPVVIMLITRGNNVLLGRSPFWPQGMMSLLAGFVEPGEPIEAAVRREVFEETRIEVGEVEYLSSQPWPFPNSLMIGCRGEALNDEIVVDPKELESALWVSREQLLQAMAGENPEIKPARRGSIAHFLLQRWLADDLD